MWAAVSCCVANVLSSWHGRRGANNSKAQSNGRLMWNAIVFKCSPGEIVVAWCLVERDEGVGLASQLHGLLAVYHHRHKLWELAAR